MDSVTDDGRLLAFLAVAATAAAGIAARRGGSRVHYGPPARRRSFRGQTVRYLTASDLEETFDRNLSDEQRARLLELAQALRAIEGEIIHGGYYSTSHSDTVDEAMNLANEILDGSGVESLFPNHPGQGLYVNMGDTYATTILWEPDYGAYIGCWGDVVERPVSAQREYACTHCGYEGRGNEFAEPGLCRDCYLEMYGEAPG